MGYYLHSANTFLFFVQYKIIPGGGGGRRRWRGRVCKRTGLIHVHIFKEIYTEYLINCIRPTLGNYSVSQHIESSLFDEYNRNVENTHRARTLA